MTTTEEELFKRQVESEFKNAQKSEDRKLKQKRKLSDELKNEPKPKKKKNDNFIPVSPRDLEAIRDHFWTTTIDVPLLKRRILISTYTCELMSFGCYPILLSAPRKVNGKNKPDGYCLGVTRAPLVLSGLRKLFSTLYPERLATDFQLWDAYRWNRSYYGAKVEKMSYQNEAIELQMIETKPFGGPKDPTTVHWLEESKLARWEKAVSLESYFAQYPDIDKLPRPKLNQNFKVWPANHLANINSKVEELKKQFLSAENAATEKLQNSDVAEAMKNLKDYEDDESSNDSE